MKATAPAKNAKTVVGAIDPDVLAFTVGQDPVLDLRLAEWDCYGTAAHVTMLSRMKVKPRLFSKEECAAVLRELAKIRDAARAGQFRITEEDHRKWANGASNEENHNLYPLVYDKQMSRGYEEYTRKRAMVYSAGGYAGIQQYVATWAGAYAEELLCSDVPFLATACDCADRCPLGSAASYGVPLPIDRELTARLLGFRGPVANVLAAGNSRGKVEAETCAALAQVMVTLSRLAQDLILFSMPEFGYFSLPKEFCTGSSIMPQKYNPDVCELVRSKAAQVCGLSATANAILVGMPGGYNRDLQDTKKIVMEALDTTRASLRILARLVGGLKAHPDRLRAAFAEPGVFATDRALELVAGGMPWRDAYHQVRDHLEDLRGMDPDEAIAKKRHLGAPGAIGPALAALGALVRTLRADVRADRARVDRTLRRLLPETR